MKVALDLRWAMETHHDSTVREVARLMLEAGRNEVDRAEAVARYIDDEREMYENQLDEMGGWL